MGLFKNELNMLNETRLHQFKFHICNYPYSILSICNVDELFCSVNCMDIHITS